MGEVVTVVVAVGLFAWMCWLFQDTGDGPQGGAPCGT